MSTIQNSKSKNHRRKIRENKDKTTNLKKPAPRNETGSQQDK